MLLLLSLLGGAAHAQELDLRLILPDAEPVALTLRELGGSSLPDLRIAVDARRSYRVTTHVEERDGGASFLVELTIDEETVRRRGRVSSRRILAPSMLVRPDQEAAFHAGQVVQAEESGQGSTRELIGRVEMRVRTDA